MALLEGRFANSNNWFAIPTPKPDGYYPYYGHLEHSYNDSVGNVHRDYVWRNRAKIECSWNSLNNAEYSSLQEIYEQDEFYMRFTDNKGRRVEKIMYGSIPKGNVYSYDKTTYVPIIWTNISMNFVEKRR